MVNQLLCNLVFTTRRCMYSGMHLIQNHCYSRSSMAEVIKINTTSVKDFAAHVTLASDCLLAGGVIAVPTDTIYGLAVLAQNTIGINRVYDIKGRNGQKPLAISVAEVPDLYKWGHITVPDQLLLDLLPGPVTLIFDRMPELNPNLNPRTSTIGLRIPDYSFMKEIARCCAGPIALTSANITASQSTLSVQEFQNLWPSLDLVFDGGLIGSTVEARFGSTVIDLSKPGQFKVIRPGCAYEETVALLKDKYHLQSEET